jgi:hypothetical protein
MVSSCESTTVLYRGVDSSRPLQSQTDMDAHPGQYTVCTFGVEG